MLFSLTRLKSLLKISAILGGLIVTSSAFAASGSMALNSYFKAECAEYSGHWSGIVTDPSDLYGNGGPWPIKVSFTPGAAANVSFSMDTPNAPDYLTKVLDTQFAEAVCHNGSLFGLKIKGKSGNGQGEFISKNVMILKLPVQGGMMGTEFVLILHR